MRSLREKAKNRVGILKCFLLIMLKIALIGMYFGLVSFQILRVTAADGKKTNTPISIQYINYTRPVTGEYPSAASVEIQESFAHHAEIADRVHDPEILTKKSNNSEASIVFLDGVWGFIDQLTGSTDGKFDIYGDSPMSLSFKLYMKNPPVGDLTLNIIGKMDQQYGFQIENNRLILYKDSGENGWTEEEYPLSEDMFCKWHDIVIIYDGVEQMSFYVDGIKSRLSLHFDEGPILHYDTPFTIGYNPEKDDDTMFTSMYGYLADVKLYGIDASNNFTNDYDKIVDILDAQTPLAHITVTPYDAVTTWSTEDGHIMNDSEVFKAETSYTATTVLSAHDGFEFDDAQAISVLHNGSAGSAHATIERDEDSKTITVTTMFDHPEGVSRHTVNFSANGGSCSAISSVC